jgi:hypothetical protein
VDASTGVRAAAHRVRVVPLARYAITPQREALLLGCAAVSITAIHFHLVLGLGLLVASIETLVHALAPANWPTHQPIALLAGLEALGAMLFLVPRTLRVGALVLVLATGHAFVVHGLEGWWRRDLAIYAAGAWFVFAHGSGWQAGGSGSRVAA